MGTERIVHYVINGIKFNLQLRNLLLFEKYTTPGSIVLCVWRRHGIDTRK
jgi:hypothetical protein